MAYVIKVEYAGSLRRLLSSRGDKEDLSFAKLEARIRVLFQIPSTEQLKMTYKDKENDFIVVDNDLDLTDACVTQKINPLYIRVNLVPKAADKRNSQGTVEPVKTSSNGEPVKEPNTSEKSTKKIVKVVDPVFQRIIPPNCVPRMRENIVKTMIPKQAHVTTDENATTGSSQPVEKNNKTEREKEISDQVPNKCDCGHNCQMYPIVGPRSKSVKKVGTGNECKRCQQPITGVSSAETKSVKLVYHSPAVVAGPACLNASPLPVFDSRGVPCSRVKSC